MTQEQLALLVGVSRQAVAKWETAGSYPETEKLIRLSQIFECTLDELVSGDLTGRPFEAGGAPAADPQDICGYDQAMRARASERHATSGQVDRRPGHPPHGKCRTPTQRSTSTLRAPP